MHELEASTEDHEQPESFNVFWMGIPGGGSHVQAQLPRRHTSRRAASASGDRGEIYVRTLYLEVTSLVHLMVSLICCLLHCVGFRLSPCATGPKI